MASRKLDEDQRNALSTRDHHQSSAMEINLVWCEVLTNVSGSHGNILLFVNVKVNPKFQLKPVL